MDLVCFMYIFVYLNVFFGSYGSYKVIWELRKFFILYGRYFNESIYVKFIFNGFYIFFNLVLFIMFLFLFKFWGKFDIVYF